MVVYTDNIPRLASAIVNGNLTVNNGSISTPTLYVNGTAVTGTPSQLGTLSNLTISGNASIGNVNSNIGTFTSLSVSGNINTGNVNGTLITGYLRTAAQPNITSVGTLSSLTVSGNASIGNVNSNVGTFTSLSV